MIAPLDHLPLMGKPGDAALGRQGRHDRLRAAEAMTGRLAAWIAGQGLAPGSRIAAWLPKGPAAAILPLAVARAGHVYVPVIRCSSGAVAHILADSGAAMLVSQEARLATLEPGDAPVDAILINGLTIDDVMTSADCAALGPSDADPDALVEILYTSGSTGLPKGVEC